jgi:hypothetical protein
MTAFFDLDDYRPLPRVLGLVVSRVVTTVTQRAYRAGGTDYGGRRRTAAVGVGYRRRQTTAGPAQRFGIGTITSAPIAEAFVAERNLAGGQTSEQGLAVGERFQGGMRQLRVGNECAGKPRTDVDLR